MVSRAVSRAVSGEMVSQYCVKVLPPVEGTKSQYHTTRVLLVKGIVTSDVMQKNIEMVGENLDYCFIQKSFYI